MYANKHTGIGAQAMCLTHTHTCNLIVLINCGKNRDKGSVTLISVFGSHTILRLSNFPRLPVL